MYRIVAFSVRVPARVCTPFRPTLDYAENYQFSAPRITRWNQLPTTQVRHIRIPIVGGRPHRHFREVFRLAARLSSSLFLCSLTPNSRLPISRSFPSVQVPAHDAAVRSVPDVYNAPVTYT